MTQSDSSCGCAICDLKIDFPIDGHLLGEIEKHNCVIFAGSGISTETRYTHPDTLYDTIRHKIQESGHLDFWDLVDRFEAQPNGRQKIIELIKDRFAYINSFRDLRESATRFHQSLGNAPYFKTIITTNWDRYFEDVIEATPFVYDGDIPFWESAKRPVLKIHGSIDNFSSIVASTEDYAACEERLRQGALGAVVKQIFATKTCIFCGYSARDKDFRRIFQTIKDGLGQSARVHYLVSPYISDDEASELRERFGIEAIRTDATHFVETIKLHMREKFCYSSDDSFNEILDELIEFQDMHHEFVSSFDLKDHPHLIFASSYQDGVIHAFQRIVDRHLTGEFADMHAVQGRIAGYTDLIADRKSKRNNWDAAYFSGYRNGLMQFVFLNDKNLEEVPPLPEFYHPGSQELYKDEYDELVRSNPEIHKGALKEAKRKVGQMPGEGLVAQHLPW